MTFGVSDQVVWMAACWEKRDKVDDVNGFSHFVSVRTAKNAKKNHPEFTYTPRTSAPYVKQTRAYLSSASFIQRSSTGFIFCALFGVMSNFSNLPNMASISIGPIKAREDRKCSKSDSH